MNSPCHKYSLIFVALTLSLILGPVNNARAGDFVVIFKGGEVRLADETQTLDGETKTFTENSDKTLAVAWEIRNDKNVGLGMEYLRFEHDFTSPSAAGYTKTELYLFNARKYFDLGKMVHPFGGIGLGWGYTKLNRASDITRDWNPVLQISAGVEIRLADELGLFIEGKGLASGTDGERANEFDFSGPALLVGISFIF